MRLIQQNITDFFAELLNDLKCQADTKNYIVGIYGKYKTTNFDLSQDSITVLFSQARNKQDFSIYQNLGDWLFYINSLGSEHLRFASQDYYDTIARLSYYSCYKLINKQWKLYEEIADLYVPLQQEIKGKLPQLKIF